MAAEDRRRRALLILLDTDVLIEIRRGDPRITTWFTELSEPTKLAGMAPLEFLIGSRNAVELRQSERFLNRFEVLWQISGDNALARELVLRHKLSTGLSFADYLIAAQSLNLGATLASFNLRHFRAIPDLEVRAPYVR